MHEGPGAHPGAPVTGRATRLSQRRTNNDARKNRPPRRRHPRNHGGTTSGTTAGTTPGATTGTETGPGIGPGAGTHRVPILIVGGSLVGLSMSVFLGRLGVRHTLVERHAGTSIHPRGRGNNVRTMELFRVAGTEPDIRRAAATLADNHGILQTPTLVGDAGSGCSSRSTPEAAWPASAPAPGACAARTTWNPNSSRTPRTSAATSASARNCSPSSPTPTV